MGNAESSAGFSDFMTGFDQGISKVPIIGNMFDLSKGSVGLLDTLTKPNNLMLIGGAVLVIMVLK